MKYLGSCAAALKEGEGPPCCYSCHEDEAEGYSSFVEIKVQRGYYEVCCTVAEYLKKKNGCE